jgi:hypothetical protein
MTENANYKDLETKKENERAGDAKHRSKWNCERLSSTTDDKRAGLKLAEVVGVKSASRQPGERADDSKSIAAKGSLQLELYLQLVVCGHLE